MTTAAVIVDKECTYIAADFTFVSGAEHEAILNQECNSKILNTTNHTLVVTGVFAVAQEVQRVVNDIELNLKMNGDQFIGTVVEELARIVFSDSKLDSRILIVEDKTGNAFEIDSLGGVLPIKEFSAIGSGGKFAAVAYKVLSAERGKGLNQYSNKRLLEMVMQAAGDFDAYSCKTLNDDGEAFEIIIRGHGD